VHGPRETTAPGGGRRPENVLEWRGFHEQRLWRPREDPRRPTLLPDPAALTLFMVATIALNLTPGPDMLYVVANGVGRGRRAGVVSALGIGAGTVVHTVAAALGLSALVVSSAVSFEVIRYAGAVYLLFLGVQTLRHGVGPAKAGPAQGGSLAAVFRRGMITNVLNPKVALFFLAFLPQFVDPSRGSSVWQFLVLGMLFNTSGTLVNSGVALASGTVGQWFSGRSGASRLATYFSGSVFLALGLRLAVAGAR
jgi:threonine/homoserine/homoserine lactone efflux protein